MCFAHVHTLLCALDFSDSMLLHIYTGAWCYFSWLVCFRHRCRHVCVSLGWPYWCHLHWRHRQCPFFHHHRQLSWQGSCPSCHWWNLGCLSTAWTSCTAPGVKDEHFSNQRRVTSQDSWQLLSLTAHPVPPNLSPPLSCPPLNTDAAHLSPLQAPDTRLTTEEHLWECYRRLTLMQAVQESRKHSGIVWAGKASTLGQIQELLEGGCGPSLRLLALNQGVKEDACPQNRSVEWGQNHGPIL